MPAVKASQLAFVALAVVASPAVAEDFQAVTGQLVPGRCHMNECGWAIFDSVEPVIDTKRGSLFRIHERDFAAEYPDGDYSKHRPRKLVRMAESYVICSKTHPATIDKSDEKSW